MDKENLKPWEVVRTILDKNYVGDKLPLSYTKYIINRFFANDLSYVILTKYMNKNYPYLSNQMHYDFWYYVTPKTSKKLFYPKFGEKKIKNVECVAKYFEVSFEEAEMYLKNLSKEEIKKITFKCK